MDVDGEERVTIALATAISWSPVVIEQEYRSC